MDILTLMQQLDACHGPSGSEKAVAQVLTELARPYVDEITTDVMGNLFCHKKGSGPKVMFAAHMDSIGFIVTHIDEKGFLRVGKVGGVTAAEVLYLPVRFRSGARGVVVPDLSADEKKLKIDDLAIDIGAHSREEAEKLVRVGDTAVYDALPFAMGECISGPYMDNRISCVVLLLAMEQLQKSDNDLWFVFTVQEEVGLRGAKTAAWAVDPDYGIVVDVTDSDDVPGTKHDGSSVLGGGAAIKVMDSSVICHPEAVQKLEALAKDHGIKYQLDVIRAGGTDAGEIHKTRCGVVTGGVSIPCRYIHTPVETVDKTDVEACAKLVAAFAESKLET